MGKEKIILTGDRPTGRLHIGHYVGSLKRRVDLQNAGDYSKMFIFIADSQALTDNIDNPEKVRQNVIEVALDYLACGIDPTKATIFIQSQIPELCELSFYYMDLVSVSRLQRNPTVKSEIQMRNFEASIPVGFFTYPISQAADITAFRATTVPVGEDQEPMLEQAREIVRRFNYIYGETLVEPEILLPDNAACLRLPGTDGKAKMSKSLGNCIYLSEEPEEIQKKIMSMYTDPGHLRVQDPGKIEGNTVFTYLDAFCLPEHFERYLPDYPNLAELKAHYQRGGLGDVKVKRFLNSIMQETLEPIRNRRKEFSKDIPAIYEMLQQGCEVARAAAAETLADVKKARIAERPAAAYKHSVKVSINKIYRSRDVLDIELAGFRIISTLLELMIDAVTSPEKAYSKLLIDRVSSQYNINSPVLYERIQAVLDYISGMTDVFALDLYRKINGNSLPAV